MRPVVTASAILFLLISSAALDGQGQNFVFERGEPAAGGSESARNIDD